MLSAQRMQELAETSEQRNLEAIKRMVDNMPGLRKLLFRGDRERYQGTKRVDQGNTYKEFNGKKVTVNYINKE